MSKASRSRRHSLPPSSPPPLSDPGSDYDAAEDVFHSTSDSDGAEEQSEKTPKSTTAALAFSRFTTSGSGAGNKLLKAAQKERPRQTDARSEAVKGFRPGRSSSVKVSLPSETPVIIISDPVALFKQKKASSTNNGPGRPPTSKFDIKAIVWIQYGADVRI